MLRRFDLAEGCATWPFHSVQPLPFALFVFISSGPAVICCDKAASTGDARVSRVEGHASVRRRALSSTLPWKKGQAGYDIFVIMLLDTCPSVTTAPGNKLPVDFSFLFLLFSFSLYGRVHARITPRGARNERVAELLAPCVFMSEKDIVNEICTRLASQRSSINRLDCFVLVSIVFSFSACQL